MWHTNSTEDVSNCISEVIQVLISQRVECVQNIIHGLQQPEQNLFIGGTFPGMTWLLKSDVFPWLMVIPLLGCWLSLGKSCSCYLLLRKCFLSFSLCTWWFGPCQTKREKTLLAVLGKEQPEQRGEDRHRACPFVEGRILPLRIWAVCKSWVSSGHPPCQGPSERKAFLQISV